MSSKPDILGIRELATFLRGDLVLPPTDWNRTLQAQSLFDFSKRTTPSVFVAYRGIAIDGHSSIGEAFSQGATLAVVEHRPALEGKYPGVVVPDARVALSKLAAYFSAEPSTSMNLIGITGTNGKSTTHWLIWSALRELTGKALRIGTLGISDGENEYTEFKAMTTPPAPVLQQALAKALGHGIQDVVLEVSSHGLRQSRVADARIQTGVFTNLTSDHLDFHKDMEDYFQAKLQLFEMISENFGENGIAVTNIDCPYGRRVADISKDLGLRVVTFGNSEDADIRLLGFKTDLNGLQIKLKKGSEVFELRSTLYGEYNAYNLLCALSTLHATGHALPQVIGLLESASGVPGRLQKVQSEKGLIFVDYAHTPDGLQKVLSTLKQLPHDKLWVLFGCGGDRDPRRRTGMGKVASEYADHIVITTDNPRSEDPQNITNDILESGCRPIFVELDRSLAIHKAVHAMGAGDILLLAGKGHENYQILGPEVFYFSDYAEAQRAVQEKESSSLGAYSGSVL